MLTFQLRDGLRSGVGPRYGMAPSLEDMLMVSAHFLQQYAGFSCLHAVQTHNNRTNM